MKHRRTGWKFIMPLLFALPFIAAFALVLLKLTPIMQLLVNLGVKVMVVS